MGKALAGVWVLLATLSGCAAGDQEEKKEPEAQSESATEVCVPGHQTACACEGGSEGLQVCNDAGTAFGACDCPETQPDPGDACGDGQCLDGEDCHSCDADCGACEPCDVAPSCDDATVPPTDLPHRMDFDVPKMEMLTRDMMRERLAQQIAHGGDAIRVLAAALDDAPASDEHSWVTSLREVFAEHPTAADALRRQLSAAGMGSPAQFRHSHPEARIVETEVVHHDVEYPGGSAACGAPLLRLAVSRIEVHEEDDDFANDIVYCVVQAEAGAGAEIRITPQTPNLDEGDDFTFALESGVFWGQLGPTTPAGSILVTYDCIEADTSGGYQALVNAIGQAAGQIGDTVEGDNGWIFDTAAAIAPVVSTGLALDNDDHLFNAQQTIPLESQLELTNGAFWTVRREGTHSLSDWDWELTIKAWGCAEYGLL